MLGLLAAVAILGGCELELRPVVAAKNAAPTPTLSIAVAVALSASLPCESEFLAAASAEMSVLLDPSDQNRRAKTQAVIERVLLPNVGCERLDEVTRDSNPSAGDCVSAVVHDFWPFADHDLLATAVRSHASALRSCLGEASHVDPRRQQFNLVNALTVMVANQERSFPVGNSESPRAELAKRLEKAESVCAGKTCSDVDALVWSHHPTARSRVNQAPFEQQVTPARILWLSSREKAASRSEFLDACLRRSGDYGSPENLVRAWAISEVIGERDPRLWNLGEVALLRGLEADAARRVFHRMGRIVGFQRAEELLGKRSDLELPPPPTEKNASALLWRSERHGQRNFAHFKGEVLVYRAGWMHLPEAKTSGTAGTMRRGGMSFEEYAAKRWAETDRLLSGLAEVKE